MQLTRAPDLGAPKLVMAATAIATLVVAVVLGLRESGGLAHGYGDTDDAMRLVLVRDLLAGSGWYDQLVERLQPPRGLQMHWSRLIDGGIAALVMIFRLFTGPAIAEWAARFVWPLLWIPPAVWASLVMARRLAGGIAVLPCTALLLTQLSLYLQFRPGRIDHHGPQIALFLLALSGAAMETVGGAALAGVTSGLGLAVGLEALVFLVVVGAFFPLAFLLGRDFDGRRLRAYALGLGGSTIAAYLVQTPPWRWSAVACDAIGANMAVAVAVACVGLLVVAAATRGRDWRWRLGALAVAGAGAAGTYLILDPNCLGGPFADVDPRLKGFWLQYVQEIRSIPKVWARNRETVYGMVFPSIIGVIAWLWLGADKARRVDPAWMLAGVCLVAATAAGFSAIRMATYANWVAAPLIAAAVTVAVLRYAKGVLVVLVVAAVAATPFYWSALATALDKQVVAWTATPKPAAKPAPKAAAKRSAGVRGDRCFQIAAYQELAKLPPGLVLGEIDLGPFVLAYTHHSAMAAPYHRMNWGMLTARGVSSTEAEAAQTEARRLGFRYVIECPGHIRNADRVGMAANSLQKRLDAGKPPSWLEQVQTNGAIRVYRVRPQAGGAA